MLEAEGEAVFAAHFEFAADGGAVFVVGAEAFIVEPDAGAAFDFGAEDEVLDAAGEGAGETVEFLREEGWVGLGAAADAAALAGEDGEWEREGHAGVPEEREMRGGGFCEGGGCGFTIAGWGGATKGSVGGCVERWGEERWWLGQTAAALDGAFAEAFVDLVGDGVEFFAAGALGVGEEGQLGFALAEAFGGHADEADGLEGPVVEEGEGGGPEFVGDIGGGGEGGGAIDGLEVAVADFEGDAAGEEVLAAEADGDLFDLIEKDAADCFGFGDIDGEGVFVADTFGFAVAGDGAVIDAAGEVEEALGFVAAAGLEPVEGLGAEVGDGLDAPLVEASGGGLADAPDFGDGEGEEDAVDIFGADDGEAVGFVEVGGEFGEEFVGGDADGGGEVEVCGDALAERLGDGFGRAEELLCAGEIEEGFVDAKGFDEGGEFFEDGEHLGGDAVVVIAADGEDDGVGAEALGDGHGLGGMAAEAAGLVAGGGDDATGAVVADEEGLSAEVGVIALFDGGEEGVHVEVEDGDEAGGEHGGIVDECLRKRCTVTAFTGGGTQSVVVTPRDMIPGFVA